MRFFLLVATLACLTPASVQAQYYGDSNSLVDYWYRTYLGRAPDPGGMATWANELNQGVPSDQVLAGILGSSEYYQRTGANPQGFIAQLYNDVLKRAPTAVELDFWVRRMYTEDLPALALQFLDQYPGVWIGSRPAVSATIPVTPPVVVTPSVVVPGIGWNAGWYRDWHSGWNVRHGIYDYRRPYYYGYGHHGDEHHHH